MATNVCLLEEHDPVHGSSKLQVTILASEWGSSKGGLSMLNRELAIQLAKFSDVKVTFFLPKCSDEDKRAADGHCISILEAARRPGYNELDWLSFPPEHFKIDVVVGHGVKLGRQAQVICKSHKCKWVQVVHTDPEELGMFKCYDNPISKGQQKHQVEVELCQMADFIVGVGPKLTEAFRKYLHWCKTDEDVFEFTPGIFDDFASVQQDPVRRKCCTILVFGRGDAEDFELKGLDIAARCVAALSDTVLVFVGAPEGKHEVIAKRFFDFGIPANRLRVRGYMESREDLRRLFCEVDLVLMPSRTEGFGLTGLEALSVGLPVIVSKNSGFGEALGKVPCGSLFLVDSEDPSMWIVAIKGIWNKDIKLRLDEIKLVRGSYFERYNWSDQCKDLIEKMSKLVDGHSSQRGTVIIEKNENKQPAGTSSEPETTAQGVEATKRKWNENFTGTSPEPETTAQGVQASKRKRNENLTDQAVVEGNSGEQGPSEFLETDDQHSLRKYGESFVKLLISTANIEKEKEEAMNKLLTQVVQDYLKFHDHSRDNRTEAVKSFTNHLINIYGVNLVTISEGSIIIIVECPTLESLEHLWRDYLAGHLDRVAERYLVTDEMKEELNLETICLKIVIEEEDYLNCKKALEELATKCLDDFTPEARPRSSSGASLDDFTSEARPRSSSGTSVDDFTSEARTRSSSGTSVGNVIIPVRAVDLNQVTLMAQMAMEKRDFPKALHFLSLGLAYLAKVASPIASVTLLVQRAECFWQVGEFQASVTDMEQAIRAGLPKEFNNSQEEIWKWTDHGFSLYQKRDYYLAEKCVNIAFYFRDDPLVQTFLCRALICFALNQESQARKDIAVVKRFDSRLAEEAALTQKEMAFEEFKQKNYERSLRLFHLALLLHPQGNSKWMKFKRSIESHQAYASFKLKRYDQALKIGEQSYQKNSVVDVDEAKRLKERGNKLSNDPNSVDLAIRYYSLALKYTPPRDKELTAIILSNRSFMYIKKENKEAALKDATQCVKNKPDWAKAHYRLGSCLVTNQMLSEALKSFSRSLELLIEDSNSIEHHKEDTFDQLLSVAVRESGDTSSIQFKIPQNLTQKMVDKAVTDKDWNRLYVLYMGGGGEKCFKKGSGGLGTGCDARNVPIERIIHCDFPNLDIFMRILLDHNAVASEDLVDVAIQLGKCEVVNMLMEELPAVAAWKSARRYFISGGQEARQKGDKRGASRLFELFLKHEGRTPDEKRETLEILCQLYFEQKDFTRCLETGRKLKAIFKDDKDNQIKQATLWKNRGSELHKENEFDLMAEYLTLAMEFTPPSNKETLSALLSNRCLALISSNKLKEALADAKECIALKPQWFRGYSRHGTCLSLLKRHEEALREFCRAYTYARNEKEKHATAREVVSTAMEIPGGETQITCTFSPPLLLQLVKEATEKSDWKKLHFLFLGTNSRGIAFECDASFVPLDLLIAEYDTEDLDKLAGHLLRQGAPPDGLRDRKYPPLLVAMEMMKFRVAVILLRNNADPCCIVGSDIFINREGKAKQWCHLGCSALEKNDYKKAVMLLNMSLHLSDVNTEPAIETQTYHALAEAYFNINEHEQALDAGKNCFKLQSIKSEEEAHRWQVRASSLFEQPDRHYDRICKEYVNLAVKYTPVYSNVSLSFLLCLRSKVEQRLGGYTRGLEDAKNALKMDPAMLETYLLQVKCLRNLQRLPEAMQVINEYLTRETDEKLMSSLLSDALDISVKLQEETLSLTAPIPIHLLTDVAKQVIERKEWDKLRVLFIGEGGTSRHALGEGGLATNIDASGVPLGEVIHHFPSKQTSLISTLLELGASANAIDGSTLIPLNEAIEKEDETLVEKLVQKGADCCVASSDGQPMIHKALMKGLKSGNFRYLEAMMGSYVPGFQTAQDSEGNSLYHLCARGKTTEHSCHAIKMLLNANINPHICNMKGEQAIDMLRAKDPRWKMINAAMSSIKLAKSDADISAGTESKSASVKQVKSQNFRPAIDENDAWSASTDDNEEHESEEDKIIMVDEKQQWRKETLENIKKLIDSLSTNLTFPSLNKPEEQEGKEALNQHSIYPNMATEQESDNRSDVTDDDVLEEEPIDEEVETKIDLNLPFENLPWEVDCTDNVWKVMKSQNVGNNLRKRIVNKIRMLANGRWSKKLWKRLEGQPRNEGIQLYESKLTKSQRIIWEKTVAFSNRLSDSPEHRLNAENSKGKIYSDIIRVWDVVLDHEKLQRSIDHIAKSHNRGRNCLVKTKLIGIPRDSDKDDASSDLCLPSKYMEIEESNQAPQPVVKKEVQKTTNSGFSQIFYPPASSNDQEYHILKFYSFNSALVKSVLESDSSTKVDFPFKVTELEYAIVNLQPNPTTPIILLGRSGTGKTTCCLYRLWNKFQCYWEKAHTAGPYIPKYLPPEEGTFQDDEGDTKELIKQRAWREDHPSTSTYDPEQDTEAQAESDVSSEEQGEESQTQTCTTQSCNLPSEKILCEEDKPEDASSSNLEHLHQIFITKNSVLCSEVEKNFRELCHACPAAESRIKFEDRSIPARIQDIHEEEWPLFVNSRDWLLILDASLPGEPFFRRAQDGSLLRQIEGWGEEDDHLKLIPATDTDKESDEEEGGEPIETGKENEVPTERRKEQKQQRDPRREITYQVFHGEIWPKMLKSSKEKIEFHPTLVWTEIRSFIKGSAEALLSGNGVLSEDDYKSLGKKKASNFTADRTIIYGLFRIYQRVRRTKGLFDEADLLFNIHQRLQKIPAPEWSVHEFYVDETQDFTQAELSLLIRCCRLPNEMFFTGDTAQSIMRGIAFRFEDLKSLFHHAKEAANMIDHRLQLRVPKKLYQLTYNYRSHAGILHLASSVVDLLLHHFPESFDQLKKDEGLFDGPRPVLIESCSPSDLALLLQGNQRQSSRIEFGAHQVVLVASNEARNKLPDELQQALVMTIYEAKGLEFDDVLIYNFFKDSQAGKEWRVVTSFSENLSTRNATTSTGLAEIRGDDLTVCHSRPLPFDPEKHKVLNSELKYLYTAITRARVNVWFFDEDEETRAPVFEYFQKLGLVKVVSLSENEEGTTDLSNMFAAKSTPQEWQKGGHRFYKKGLWALAMKCFERAGDQSMVEKSRARQQADEALKFRYTNQQKMRDEFLKAGQRFLKCGMPEEAGICLKNSHESILVAKLYEKTGKLQEAARLYKKIGLPTESSRCYESLNNYRDAIETLCQSDHFEEALKVLERFSILSSSGDPESLQGIIPPKLTRTTERLRHLLADKHLEQGNMKKMEDTLKHLPLHDRIAFLKKRQLVSEAANAMEMEGKREEAALFLRDMGRFQEAVEYSTDPKFSADCLLSLVRTTTMVSEIDIPEILRRALDLYEGCNDINGQAEVFLLRGKLLKEPQALQDARSLFDKSKNCCGEVESVTELLKATDFLPPEKFGQWMAVRSLERLLRLISLLHKPTKQLSNVERNDVEGCEKHFGVFTAGVAQRKVYLYANGGRFAKVDPQFIESNVSKTEVTIDAAEARQRIARFLVRECFSLHQFIGRMLEKSLRRSSLCRTVTDGTPFDKDSKDLFNNSFHSMLNFVYLESVISHGVPGISSNKEAKDLLQLKDKVNKEYTACQRFYDFLFPLSGCRKRHLPNVRDVRMTNAVKRRLFQYALFLWNKADKEERRTNTNNFLKVSSLLQLTDSSRDMMTLICKEEEDFERMFPKLEDKSFQLTKNGMVSEQEGSGRYESYLHWWERGKKRLYVDCDVEKAAHLIIRRFLTLPAKRSRMIFPSIANTVMILEHQMTACLALFARLHSNEQTPVVCLPQSYLTMVQFWDSFRPDIDTTHSFTMFEAVDFNVRNAEGNKERLFHAISSILKYLVELTCGEVSSSFDVIGDALSLNNSKVEEADRAFILFLTMLCNCGKGIPISSEKVLLKKLLTLHPNSDLPSPLQAELSRIQEVKGYSDVVEILKSWLQQTRGEELLDLRWQRRKLWRDGPSKPSNYGPKFCIDVSILQIELERSQLQVQGEVNRETKALDSEGMKGANMDTTEETMEVPLTAEERQEKEEARSKVIDIEEAEILPGRRLLGLVSIEDRTSINVLEEYFSRFAVDITACTICGITFKSSAEERAPLRQEEIQEESNPVFQEGLGRKEEMMETAECHQRSQAHKQKELEFEAFKNLYVEEIYPNLMKDEGVSSSTEKGQMKDVGLDLDCLERSRNNLYSALEKIESTRRWTETTSLLVAVQEFKAELEKTSPILEQAKSDSLPQGHEEYEETVESQGEDTGYETMPEEVNPKQKKRGKRRQRNCKR